MDRHRRVGLNDDKTTHAPRYWHVYIAVRMLCCLIPQSGYIHPDEFFQTSEVVAGDILELDVQRPWEFNNSFPIRSIVLPYIVCGPGYVVLRHLVNSHYFSGHLRPPTELLLIIPRIAVLAISLTVDVLVVRMARDLHLDVSATLWCYASSYVLYVYFTRTFTNTFEAFLFTSLLYLCIRKPRRGSNSLDSVWMSFITAAGIFNRPTFPAFALTPLTYWFFIRSRSSFGALFTRLVHFGASMCLFSSLFIFCDTLYFRAIAPSELVLQMIKSDLSVKQLQQTFVVTPLNFLSYNSDSSNLAQHGTHPFYTHLTANLLLLFGPGVICLYYRLITVLLSFPWRSCHRMNVFLLCVVFLPIILLSLFPHQEARFLVPLLAPFSLACGQLLFSGKHFSWRFLKLKWFIFNVLAFLLFGFLHQGGIVPSIAFLQKYVNGLNGMQKEPGHAEYHIIYFHTYMPPTHLMGQLRDWSEHSSNKPISKRVHIHDLKGAPIESLAEKIETLSGSHSVKVLVVTPATVRWKLCKDKQFKLTRLYSVWPHLSLEDPPGLDVILMETSHHHSSCNHYSSQLNSNILSNLINLFYLDILVVNL